MTEKGQNRMEKSSPEFEAARAQKHEYPTSTKDGKTVLYYAL